MLERFRSKGFEHYKQSWMQSERIKLLTLPLSVHLVRPHKVQSILLIGLSRYVEHKKVWLVDDRWAKRGFYVRIRPLNFVQYY